MLRLAIITSCLLIAAQALAAAEQPDILYKQGISKLRDAQSDHAALIPAAKLLAQAAALYEAAGGRIKTIAQMK